MSKTVHRSCRAALLVAMALAAPAAADPDAILGVWETEPGENRARVEITRAGDRYEGKIVWLANPLYPESEGPDWVGRPKVDRENPDPAARSVPILGLKIMEGFEHSGDGQWGKGTIYDPENGKTYKCKMTLQDGVLKVRGFIGMSLLGRTTEWTRPAP